MKRVGAIAVVMLLVSVSVVPAPVAASGGFDPNCSELDEFVWVLSVGVVNSDKCDSSKLSQDIADMQSAEANQTEVDLYSAALSAEQQSEAFGTIAQNYANDAKTVAWSKGETAAIKEMDNGSAMAVANGSAKTAIDEYYSGRMLNVLEQWNSYVYQLDYIRRRAANETGVTNPVRLANTGADSMHFKSSVHIYSMQSVTLPNGTVVEVASPHAEATDNGYDYRYAVNPANGMWYTGGHTSTFPPDFKPRTIDAKAPNTNFDDITLLTFKASYSDRDRYHYAAYQQLESDRVNVKANIGVFVEGTYTEYQNGEIDLADALSRTSIMSEYANDYEQSGDYQSAVAALSAMGIESPDLEGTGTMTVTYDPTGTLTPRTGDGFLLGNAPNGSWNIGQTYNVTNLSGPVMMITTDGERHDLEGDFTIEGASTRDGTTLDVVTTKNYNYQTYNATEYKKKLDELYNLTAAYEAMFQQAANGTGPAGGGGGWFDGVELPSNVILIIGAGIALLVATRE